MSTAKPTFFWFGLPHPKSWVELQYLRNEREYTMTREATPEAQMQKLLREIICKMPSNSRDVGTLGMAHNMIGELVTERARALEGGRLMTERLDAIGRLPRYHLRDDDTGWDDWDDVEPLVSPPATAEGKSGDDPASTPIADIEAAAHDDAAPTMDPDVFDEITRTCDDIGLRVRARTLERAGNTMAYEVRNLMDSTILESLVDGENYRFRNLLREITAKWDRASGWQPRKDTPS